MPFFNFFLCDVELLAFTSYTVLQPVIVIHRVLWMQR